MPVRHSFRKTAMPWLLLCGLLVLTPGRGRADAAAEEVARLRQEIKRLEELLASTKKIEQLQREVADLRKKVVEAELRTRSVQARNEQLLEQLVSAQKELARLKGEKPPRDKPVTRPPEPVEGLVKQVNGEGLVVIGIGSDAGLQIGHTLEVYRLKPTAIYLGRVRLVGIKPGEAIGKSIDRMKEAIQAGDHVASGLGDH
jgi:hypothetical protein